MFPVATLPPRLEPPAIERPSSALLSYALDLQRMRSNTIGPASQPPMFSSTISRPDPAWVLALSRSAARLRDLRAGWDGIGSQPIANHVIFRAETLARDALTGQKFAIAPYLVPGSDGSVQIEWHERNGELELTVESDGEVSLWIRDHQTGQEFQGQGEKALSLFSRWAPRLAANIDSASNVSVAAPQIDFIAT